MKKNNNIQLSSLVDTASPQNIYKEIKKIFYYHYPHKHFNTIRYACTIVSDLFNGRFPGYRACNTEYHNFSHTLDAILAATRLLDGYNLSNQPFPVRIARNLLIATLLHDAGYIQESDDTEGTGAKYTKVHVERSIAFLIKHHGMFDLDKDDITSIQKMILCTGITVKTDTIDFNSEEERFAGLILGSSDLLGQMSDRTYLEKLLFLYYEFKEAGIEGFNTEYDMIYKTVDFYELTKKRLSEENRGVSRYARVHFRSRYGIDRDLYMEAINRHIKYLHKIIEDDTTNFRRKLKRAPWIETYRGTQGGPSVSH